VVFGTEVFRQVLDFKKIWKSAKQSFIKKEETKKLNTDWKNILSIIDFYFYRDNFISSEKKKYIDIVHVLRECIEDKDFFMDIEYFEGSYFPVLKMSLKIVLREKWNTISAREHIEQGIKNIFEDKSLLQDITALKKVFLWFSTENVLIDTISDIRVKKFFSEGFFDVSDLKLENLSLDYSIPENIFVWKKSFVDIKINLLKIQHNLFILKQSYSSFQENTSEWVLWETDELSPYVQFMWLRKNVTQENLEKTIINYEKMLEKFFSKLWNNI